MRTWIAGITATAALLGAAGASAQTTGTISGTVLDSATMLPLGGGQVSILGTRLLARVGPDGRFLLESVPLGDTRVRAQAIGYRSADLLVTVTTWGEATAEFRLQRAPVELEQVVVVGYGTQRRGDVTGAVSTVTAEEFVEAPARDAGSLIAGKVAGLAITTPSGDPRSGTEVMLRGSTTIRGPRGALVLVDGVPGDLDAVAPQDIESVDVLKDGSAAAIYGSRASNGVILITTKRNAGGTPSVRYDSWMSGQTIYRSPDFLDAADYRRVIADQQATSAPDTLEDFGYSTDWQDLMLRNPVSFAQSVTIAGGGANTNYTAALTQEAGQGIFERSDNRELTARVNVGHSMFDGRLSADLNLLTRVENAFTGPNYSYAWRQTLIRNPTDRVTDSTGAWQERGTYFYVNPLGLINEENGAYEARNLRLHGTVTFRPTAKLRLSLLGGTERGSFLSGSATTFRHTATTIDNLNGTARRSTNASVDRILEATATYDATVGRHGITLLGGYSYQDFLDEGFDLYNFDFPTDLFGYDRVESGNALTLGRASINSGRSSSKVIGFFSRVNYNWNNRYLLMASVRYEGNSVFGAAHKWGLFPAVSAGWRLSEERFLDGAGFIDDLKLRVGYGVTGIAPSGPYQSLTSYTYGGRMLYEGEWVQGIAPSRNPNPDLRWERKDEVNVGLDFSLLDFRLSGSLDWYRRDTRDMLYNYSVPVPPNLFGSILANVGRMRNTGLEAQVAYDVVRRPAFRWTTSANWSTNSNRLVSLSNDVYVTSDCFTPQGHTGEPIQQSTHRVCVGGEIGNFWGWKSVDIDANGEWIVLDSAGTPIPMDAATENDRRVIGNGIPDWYLAWNNSLRFKNFDLSINMRGAFGHQILNYQRMYYENPTILEYNLLKSAFDLVYGKEQLNYDLAYVSYYVEDGDYWKLDNVTVGYSFTPGQLPILRNTFTGARVYVAGRNLLTITGYKGLDPEVTLFGTNDGLSPGLDSRDKYPTTRSFSAGLTLTF